MNASISPDTLKTPNRPGEVIWSSETTKLLSGLTVLERSFVEYYSAGMSASAAYLAATSGRQASNQAFARQYAYAIQRRSRVRAALAAACRDRQSAEAALMLLNAVTPQQVEVSPSQADRTSQVHFKSGPVGFTISGQTDADRGTWTLCGSRYVRVG